MRYDLWLRLAFVAAASIALAAQGASPSPPRGRSADFVGPGPLVALPDPIAAAASRLNAASLAAHIAFLASPALGGRGLEGQGLEAAAEYVAASLALSGVAPSGGREAAARGGYFQPVPIRVVTQATAQLVIRRGGDAAAAGRTVAAGAECVFPEISPQEISGGVVFAGFGISEPSFGRDDLAALELKGRIALVIGGVPPGEAWQRGPLASRYGARSGRLRYAAKARALAGAGAVAMLVVEANEAVRREDESRATYYLPLEDSTAPDDLPVVRISPALAATLAGTGSLGQAALGPLGVEASIRVSGAVHAAASRNVIGVLAGSNPARRSEAIVLGAHFDHLGRLDGAIHPGADDNGSGVAALLEIARAFAASPVKPARTLVFAFWTGEEEGHLGSDHYLRHPLWPVERTSAYANLDMLAFPWAVDAIRQVAADAGLPAAEVRVLLARPADFVEPGVADWAPELGGPLERAARGLGLVLHLDRTDGRNGGSDYRAFARRHVPFIRFCGEYPPGYHKPTDTPEATDAAQALKIARLALATTWLLADR